MTARPWFVVFLLGLLNFAVAHADKVRREGKIEVDTQFIFGFAAGADVEEPGENELEQKSVSAGISYLVA
jgi:hypothetical protein